MGLGSLSFGRAKDGTETFGIGGAFRFAPGLIAGYSTTIVDRPGRAHSIMGGPSLTQGIDLGGGFGLSNTYSFQFGTEKASLSRTIGPSFSPGGGPLSFNAGVTFSTSGQVSANIGVGINYGFEGGGYGDGLNAAVSLDTDGRMNPSLTLDHRERPRQVGTGVRPPDKTTASEAARVPMGVRPTSDTPYGNLNRGGSGRGVVSLEQTPICFVAGTLVVVGVDTDGSPITKAIDSLRVGDVVLSRSEHDANAPILARTVLEAFERRADTIIRLAFRDERGRSVTLGVTPEHPFCRPSVGWTRAGDLLAGHELLGLGTGRLTVTSVAVFNLKVDEDLS